MVLEKILKFVYVFWIFCNYLPLEKDGIFHLNKLESVSLKDDLYQVLLKLAKWFWWRWFLNLSMYFRYFSLSPLGKKRGLHLNKLESPSVVLEKMIFQIRQCIFVIISPWNDVVLHFPSNDLYQAWLTLAQFLRRDF